jgi:hypothetical protein
MDLNTTTAFSGHTIGSFESKADALVWAISFTLSWTPSSGNTINYNQAQELFDFICRNINLPDTKSMNEFFATAKESLAAVLDRVPAKKETDEPCKDVEEHGPDPMMSQETPDLPCDPRVETH